MPIYRDYIFPRLCDLVMRQPEFSGHRHELLQHASGRILEIGIGSGLNLQHYPKSVRQITTIDPNVGFSRLLRRRIHQSQLAVEHHVQSAESLAFDNDTFDCVVSTWTLCSVADANQSVAELYRVLKPGGQFLLIEHGLSNDPSVQCWQRRLNWLQSAIAGCRLDLDVTDMFAHRPFGKLELSTFYFGGAPRTHGTMYRAIATK